MLKECIEYNKARHDAPDKNLVYPKVITLSKDKIKELKDVK